MKLGLGVSTSWKSFRYVLFCKRTIFPLDRRLEIRAGRFSTIWLSFRYVMFVPAKERSFPWIDAQHLELDVFLLFGYRSVTLCSFP